MTLHQLKTQLDSILNYQIRLAKRGVNNEEINDIQIYLQNEIIEFNNFVCYEKTEENLEQCEKQCIICRSKQRFLKNNYEK